MILWRQSVSVLHTFGRCTTFVIEVKPRHTRGYFSWLEVYYWFRFSEVCTIGQKRIVMKPVLLCLIAALLCHESMVLANVVDRLPEPIKKVVLEINGTEVWVDNGAIVDAVWGDEVRVKKVIDGNGNPPPALKVNFVGFPNNNPKNPLQDLGYIVHTHSDLLRKWARNEEGNLYEIKALIDRQSVGSVFLKLRDPELSYIVFSLNGHEKVIRAGDILSVEGTDKFEVVKIVTNIKNSESGLTFSLIPIRQPVPRDRTIDFGLYELVFYRFDKEFSRIPVHVKS